MTRTAIALLTATSMAAAAAVLPTRAEAYPVWVVPAIIAAGVGGLVVGGGVVASQQAYADERYANPRGTVYVRPSGAAQSCTIVRERMADGRVRRVQVCE